VPEEVFKEEDPQGGSCGGRAVAGIEVEVIDVQSTSQAPPLEEVRRLCAVAAAVGGVMDGHVAIEFVDAQRIAELNAEYRGKASPTDVLSFPIDGAPLPTDGAPCQDSPTISDGASSPSGPPRELGDVVICVEHTEDVHEAIVHGVLHLVGMDHETDRGEMLAVQAEILRWEQIDPQEIRQS
jgi:probable rRNA maturation factor